MVPESITEYVDEDQSSLVIGSLFVKIKLTAPWTFTVDLQGYSTSSVPLDTKVADIK
jgi:hypothetical protein